MAFDTIMLGIKPAATVDEANVIWDDADIAGDVGSQQHRGSNQQQHQVEKLHFRYSTGILLGKGTVNGSRVEVMQSH